MPHGHQCAIKCGEQAAPHSKAPTYPWCLSPDCLHTGYPVQSRQQAVTTPPVLECGARLAGLDGHMYNGCALHLSSMTLSFAWQFIYHCILAECQVGADL